jgi:DDE superfamily endonuclease
MLLFRFMFLPENSTHIMQPLDVAVFGPMKTRWRTILADWKEDCAKQEKNYNTIPKQVFPKLLKELLEKDFGPAIRAGFEASGLYPFSVSKAVSKLPQDINEREMESQVVGTLVKKLDVMRHHAPANKPASRPKKADKLPPGAAYTCPPEDSGSGASGSGASGSGASGSGASGSGASGSGASSSGARGSSRRARGRDDDYEGSSKRARGRDDDYESSSSDSSDSEDEDEEIRAIVEKLAEQSDEEEEEEEDDPADQLPAADVHYPVECFVIAVYNSKWYLAQVLDKDKESTAEKGDEYLILSFMEQVGERNCFKWPERKDILNTVKDDIIYKMKHPPTISGATSSRVSCAIAWTEFDQAKIAFRNYQAYYPTKISIYLGYHTFIFYFIECV